MGVNTKLVSAFNRMVELGGTKLRIRYYDPIYDDTYDEATELMQSGTDLWISGVVLPVNTRQGSHDSNLLQQGKIVDSDKKIYVNGSIAFTGSIQLVDVQIGSPGDLFTSIPDGGIQWEAEGIPVYKQQFVRKLTGSLLDA
jgi:hypothetical protein